MSAFYPDFSCQPLNLVLCLPSSTRILNYFSCSTIKNLIQHIMMTNDEKLAGVTCKDFFLFAQSLFRISLSRMFLGQLIEIAHYSPMQSTS